MAKLQMSADEICRSYREAKEPNRQIQILAQLNCTDTETIIGILKENNEPLKKRPYRTPEKKNIPDQAKPSKDKMPDSVVEAIRRRIEELDEIITNTEQVLEKNIQQRNELKEYLFMNIKKSAPHS